MPRCPLILVMTQWTVVQTPQQIQVAQCEKAILSPDLGNDTGQWYSTTNSSANSGCSV